MAEAFRSGTVIVVSLNTLFILLDLWVIPKLFFQMLAIRLVWNSVLIGLHFSPIPRDDTARVLLGLHLTGLGLVVVIASAGGLPSGYAPGLMLLFLGMPVLVPMSAGEAARVERSIIASRAGSGSGGISTSGMSRDTGGGGLAGRATTQVSSPVAGMGDTGPRVVKGGSAPSRSREEIELVFDKNKGSIFALYNRALRRDPTLQGKIVLEMTIAPSGVVTACRVVSSELGDPEMERKLIQRVKMFRFKDKDVAIVTTTKPIDFFPA
jgi:TonB family protein